MPLPVMAALQVASTIAGMFGASADERNRQRQTRMANSVLARILPVQRDQFNTRYTLSNDLNNVLASLEAQRYNDVTGREVAVRGGIGDESIRRFDEQAAAVDNQVAANRTSATQLLDSSQTAMRGGIDAYERERTRQRGFQGTADAAGAALIPNMGAAAEAVRRAAATAGRKSFADAAIGAADTGGYAPETHSRVMEEFAKRGNLARGNAMGDAEAAAAVGGYGDAGAEAARSLSSFNDMISRLKTQATTSRSALPSEIALFDRQGRRALSDFEGRNSMNNLVAGGTRDIADTYRGGRIAAMDSAGSGEIEALSNLFSRLSNTYREGYGGQISASDRYENLFSNLMRETASRIMGTTPAPSTATSLSSLFSGLSSAYGAIPRG